MEEEDEREAELTSLSYIYPELTRGKDNPFTATLDLDIELDSPINLKSVSNDGSANLHRGYASITYLPTIKVHMTLPPKYPTEESPKINLKTDPDWLPASKLQLMEHLAVDLWESWGHTQIIYTYLDELAAQAQDGFDLRSQDDDNAILLEASKYLNIMEYQARAEKAKFNQQTFDCEVCLAPKKGVDCYRMSRCEHVFCKNCLQDYYTNCITEGDVHRVHCMAFKCSIKTADGKDVSPTIAPAELLQIPISRDLVQRYAELKRKKKIEADQTTVYCPRDWCQAPARSKKYPRLSDISEMTEMDDSDVPALPLPTLDPNENDRLAICESCDYAFCKNCRTTWHGEYKRCIDKRENVELSPEEKASLDYIRKHTSECPTCLVAVQKQMGCNHMTCFQCRTHFCYLCGSWLDRNNPYKHFNTKDRECFQRLFDMAEGDDANAEVQFVGARQWEMQFLEAAIGDEGEDGGDLPS